MQVLKKLVNCRYSADHYFLVQNRQDIPWLNRKSGKEVMTTFEHMMVMRRAGIHITILHYGSNQKNEVAFRIFSAKLTLHCCDAAKFNRVSDQ